ncbi:epimerase [Vibrio cholerae]
MNILIFGASGMVGQGALREALSAADVKQIFVIGRRQLTSTDKRLTQIICEDFTQLPQSIEHLPKIDACFFCLGQSSSGMNEQQYRAVTYDLTLSAAHALVQNNTNMTFIYVSGTGTDRSEQGKIMWARVKGSTENALLSCGFSAVYLFRPAVIIPLDKIRSRTVSYRIFYQIMTPLFPLLMRLFPTYILTTRDIGQAMLNAVRDGYYKPILEVKDIAMLAKQ